MTWQEKRSKCITLITTIFNLLDESGYNSKRMKERLEAMSEAKFKEFVKSMRDGDEPVLEMPNMESQFDQDRIYEAADKLGVTLFERVKMYDAGTGTEYLTEHPYPIVEIPIRRTRQSIDHGMSLPEDDRHIDAMTGQTTGPSHAARMTKPESLILDNRGLHSTLKEFMQVRGGSPETYAEFRHQLEETGEANIQELQSPTRTSTSAGVLLTGMGIDHNLNER